VHEGVFKEDAMEFALMAGGESLRVRSPDPALYLAFQQALNVSYPEHSEFLSWARAHTTEEQALESLLKARDEFDSETGERRFFIVAADGAAIIGCIGLKPRGRNRYVVGYWANSEHSGKGYLRAALTQVLGRFPDATFYLTTSSANLRSQHLAAAAGFLLIRVHLQARHSEQHGVQDTYVYRFAAKSRAKKSPQERGRTVVS
jgi:RimJ/RimL family protein N-acetyltransferase